MLALAVATLAAAVTHAVRAERWSFAWAVSLVAGTPVIGLLLTVVGLMHSFAGVAAVDPSMKATLLAKGISEAMNATAFGLGVIPLWIAPFVIGEVRRGRRRRA
jgi:biopolymer transport protein ExbB/TolQ